MTKSYTTPRGEVLKRRGAYTNLKVEAAATGLAANGILALVGEADAGPNYAQETDLRDCWFGPDQRAEVAAKYEGGPIVAAFNAAVSPSADPAVSGAPRRIYIVKTNQGVRATSALLNHAGGAYHTLAARSYGARGNLLYYTLATKTAEVVPTTNSFTLLVPNNATNINLRVNGTAVVTPTISALDLPPTVVAAIHALAGVDCTGGANRNAITVSGTLAVAAPGSNVVVITRSIAWAANPVVGDCLYIPSGSPIQGAGNENRGSYVVTAVSNTTVTATKLLDASGGAGALTSPVAVTAQNIAAVTDLQAFAPVTISLTAADPILGAGKHLEVNELATATGRFADLAYQLNTTKVAWLSTSGSPKQLVSSAEYAVTLNVNRETDQVSEQLSAGGDLALLVGYQGTTATLTVTSTSLTTTVTGGSGSNLSISFGSVAKPSYPTLADLAKYINAQTGYSCVVASTAMGQKSVFALDEVSAIGICTTNGGTNRPGRIKMDGAKLFDAVQTSSVVQLGATTALNVAPASGLPAPVTSATYLAGGARGGTTDAGLQAALDAMEEVNFNFGIPLFSRDATEDVTDALTDSASTYTIDSINAACRTHALAMSTTKRRRERQFLCSRAATIAVQKAAAQTLATGRCSVAIDDVLTSQPGGVQQDLPWMSALLAASMQCAAFTGGGISQRRPNVVGVRHRAGDFLRHRDSQVEDALDSGLLFLTRNDREEWVFEADQTTYSRDASFYHNSVRAIYIGDVITQTARQEMARLGIGESIADFDQAAATAALTGVLRRLREAKALAPSDDAPDGFRDVRVVLRGNAIVGEAHLKFADTVDFIYMEFTLGEVTQS